MFAVGASVGDVLALIASGEARTRGALTRRTGLSRATMGERLELLFQAGLIREGELAKPNGGRPSRVLALDTDRYVVLAADVGGTSPGSMPADSRSIADEGLVFDDENGACSTHPTAFAGPKW